MTKGREKEKGARWGGSRPGAGRPPTGLPVRNRRVTVLLTDHERANLERYAERRGEPIGTAAYRLLSGALRRVAKTQ